jgi:hypothetical protein
VWINPLIYEGKTVILALHPHPSTIFSYISTLIATHNTHRSTHENKLSTISTGPITTTTYL